MRNSPLDLIRLVAILLVLGRHINISIPKDEIIGTTFMHYWAQGGWVGVDIFFVLSGFLVSGLIFREWKNHHTINLGRFIIRRFLKIYPSLWTLIFSTIIIPQKTSQPVYIKSIVSELFLFQNYSPGIWYHTWSLAVEVHFYLILISMCKLFIYFKNGEGNPFRYVTPTFLVITLLSLYLRVRTMEIQPYTFYQNFYPTHLRLDSLMFGVLLSWFWNFKDLSSYIQKRSVKLSLVVSGVILILPAFIFQIELTPWISVYGVILFYIGAGMIILGAINSTTLAKGCFAQIAHLGTYSYSIYIWHMTVRESLLPQFYKLISPFFNPIPWQANLFFYISGSILFGLVMAYLIEYPILIARDRHGHS